jgi:hypothetical protein
MDVYESLTEKQRNYEEKILDEDIIDELERFGYKVTKKGYLDRRKVTARNNLEKARASKISKSEEPTTNTMTEKLSNPTKRIPIPDTEAEVDEFTDAYKKLKEKYNHKNEKYAKQKEILKQVEILHPELFSDKPKKKKTTPDESEEEEEPKKKTKPKKKITHDESESEEEVPKKTKKKTKPKKKITPDESEEEEEPKKKTKKKTKPKKKESSESEEEEEPKKKTKPKKKEVSNTEEEAPKKKPINENNKASPSPSKPKHNIITLFQ